jgi:hypothetical protein
MKRLLIFLLILASVIPVEGGNITQKTVYLHERVVSMRFVNMGVDAYWGDHILENAALALPLIEELIGVPLPAQVESVEIYGRKDLGGEEWMVGYNDGYIVALKTDHPNPTIVFHELVHFWTIYYNIPWPIAEGYCNLYADLCAVHLGLYEVAFAETDWNQQYEMLKELKGGAPLNSLDYMHSEATEEQVEYFYLASTIVMRNFYETVGQDNMKAINRKVAESSLDSPRGGVGIIQYLGIVRDVTHVNHAGLFMPVVFTYWEPETVDSFEKAVARYFAVSELTGVSDSEEQKQALTALVGGRLPEFQAAEQAIISDFYVQQLGKVEELPEQEIIYPEKKTGLLHNKLFLFGIGMLVVVVILLIFIFSKLAKEEEEYEWEQPLPSEEPGLWTPPEGGGFVEELEELPELPDLGELTK